MVPQFQKAIAGVHRNDAMLHPLEQNQRVFAGQDGIRRIVVDAEPWGVDLVHNLDKNVHLLRELGVLPVVVLVVVLHGQDDAVLLRERQQALDTRTTWATPASRATARGGAGRKERGRSLPPKNAVISIIRFSRSISFCRSAGSGWVKSGEQQSMGISRSCFSSAVLGC